MKKFETIRFEIDTRKVAVITLDRPQYSNAINSTMIAELTRVTGILSTEKDVRACILQGEGVTFCAGGDLTFMRSQMVLEREEIIEEANKITNLLSALDNLPCPLIAKVQGSAYGGGIGLLSVCDIIIAVDDANFALRETLLGLVPATIGPFLLRRIGEAWARQYFFTAKTFDVVIAQRMNLVSRIASSNELQEFVDDEVAQILNCQPQAVTIAKAYAKKLARDPLADSRKYSAELFADRLKSNEAKEAIKQFLSRS
ncbi:MAG: enoyl-CoA hydratase [Hyphomicrobiales bacterium]|nr:enoyl-CoA hydratase [Hyphomicrobiales bacterium]